MSLKIDQDHSRFRNIVRGKVRQNLRKFISNGEIITKQGKGKVSIPIPQIDIPRFSFGSKENGGVGQGSGKPGDPVGGEPQDGQAGQAGQDEGDHALEVEMTIEELADILGEELQLPAISNKGKAQIRSAKSRYTAVRQIGPESLRHFKRTYRQALQRSIASGKYDPKHALIVPQHEDKRFRSWKENPEPVANAVIVYMMDVSGSMGDEQKEIVRTQSFWIDAWIRRHYQGVESRYIIHDAVAREVDRDTFFKTRESGGTMISSAYQLTADLLESSFPADEYNTYLFHFSDGDNWSMDDTLVCVDIMKSKLLPRVNMFAYGQVTSPYGSGQFIKDLREKFEGDERVVLSQIEDRDGIVASIKEFLGTGR